MQSVNIHFAGFIYDIVEKLYPIEHLSAIFIFCFVYRWFTTSNLSAVHILHERHT